MSAIQQTLLAYGASAPLVVSDVFSATTYTGTGVAFDLVNGIDLAGKGGMVWDKSTDDLARPNHRIFDTQRGNYALVPNSTAAQYSESRSYTSTGYNVTSALESNTSGKKYISWTFRKAPKFFDVVAYTGDGSLGTAFVSHNLGVRPRLIIAKRLGAAENWSVLALTNESEVDTTPAWRCLSLNTTAGGNQRTGSITNITSTQFNPNWLQGDNYTPSGSNIAGAQYIAYLFAHDPSSSGFIRCGGYTGNGSATGPSLSLGWEPQFLLVKCVSGAGDWLIYDSARDAVNPRTATILANSTAAESTTGPDIDFIATGFQIKSTAANVNTSGSTYIYMAIRKP